MATKPKLVKADADEQIAELVGKTDRGFTFPRQGNPDRSTAHAKVGSTICAIGSMQTYGPLALSSRTVVPIYPRRKTTSSLPTQCRQ
jgi:hypothetical protein